jgi:hypothetical protein
MVETLRRPITTYVDGYFDNDQANDQVPVTPR